jgi:hypothetical protein
VILTLAVTAGGTAERDRFTHMVAGALKISEEEAKTRIGEMVIAQHLQITSEGSAVTVAGAATATQPDPHRRRRNHRPAMG